MLWKKEDFRHWVVGMIPTRLPAASPITLIALDAVVVFYTDFFSIQTLLAMLWKKKDFRHDKVTGSWGGSPQGSQQHHR